MLEKNTNLTSCPGGNSNIAVSMHLRNRTTRRFASSVFWAQNQSRRIQVRASMFLILGAYKWAGSYLRRLWYPHYLHKAFQKEIFASSPLPNSPLPNVWTTTPTMAPQTQSPRMSRWSAFDLDGMVDYPHSNELCPLDRAIRFVTAREAIEKAMHSPAGHKIPEVGICPEEFAEDRGLAYEAPEEAPEVLKIKALRAGLSGVLLSMARSWRLSVSEMAARHRKSNR